MRKRGSVMKICALLLGLLTLSAMSSCPEDANRRQSGSANRGDGAGGGMGGGSSGGGGGY
jgi:hypothetical protein